MGTGASPLEDLDEGERRRIPVGPHLTHLTAFFGSVTADAQVTVAGVGVAPIPPGTTCVLDPASRSCAVTVTLVNHSDRAVPTNLAVFVQQRPCGSDPGGDCVVYDQWSVLSPRLGWVSPHPEPGYAGNLVVQLGSLPPRVRERVTVRLVRPNHGHGPWAGHLVIQPITATRPANPYRACASAADGYRGLTVQAGPCD